MTDRIESNPAILRGLPVIKGTRTPVEVILHCIKDGYSDEMILEEFPRLTREDIRAAMAYGADPARYDFEDPASCRAAAIKWVGQAGGLCGSAVGALADEGNPETMKIGRYLNSVRWDLFAVYMALKGEWELEFKRGQIVVPNTAAGPRKD